MLISDSSLSRYFRGSTVPPWATVRDLCRALGADPTEYRALWEAADRSQNRQAAGPGLPVEFFLPARPAQGCPTPPCTGDPAPPVQGDPAPPCRDTRCSGRFRPPVGPRRRPGSRQSPRPAGVPSEERSSAGTSAADEAPGRTLASAAAPGGTAAVGAAPGGTAVEGELPDGTSAAADRPAGGASAGGLPPGRRLPGEPSRGAPSTAAGGGRGAARRRAARPPPGAGGGRTGPPRSGPRGGRSPLGQARGRLLATGVGRPVAGVPPARRGPRWAPVSVGALAGALAGAAAAWLLLPRPPHPGPPSPPAAPSPRADPPVRRSPDTGTPRRAARGRAGRPVRRAPARRAHLREPGLGPVPRRQPRRAAAHASSATA